MTADETDSVDFKLKNNEKLYLHHEGDEEHEDESEAFLKKLHALHALHGKMLLVSTYIIGKKRLFGGGELIFDEGV